MHVLFSCFENTKILIDTFNTDGDLIGMLCDWQVDEFIMLTDPKLSVFTGDEETINSADERPQHKITNFRSAALRPTAPRLNAGK